jgi:hypothetical protein
MVDRVKGWLAGDYQVRVFTTRVSRPNVTNVTQVPAIRARDLGSAA